MSSNGNVVTLDIGGTVFKTTKATLTKFDGFFKTIMVANAPVIRDSSGTIFIDRSSKHFDLILNYMRDGDVKIPESEQENHEILKEAQHYKIDGLVMLCLSHKKIKFVHNDNELLQIIAKPAKPEAAVNSLLYLHFSEPSESPEPYTWHYTIHDTTPGDNDCTVMYSDPDDLNKKLTTAMCKLYERRQKK